MQATILIQILVLMAFGAACDTNMSVTTSGSLMKKSEKEAAGDESFALRLTSDEIQWNNVKGATSFKVIVAKDGSCEQAIKSYELSNQYSLKIADLADGMYHICALAQFDAESIPASNNGLLLTIDRTAPVITADNSYLLENGAQKIGVSVEDLTKVQTSWEQVSGPGTITFTKSNDVDPIISADVDGAYEIKLTAIDFVGLQSSKNIQIQWDAPKPPLHAAVSVAFNDTDTQGGFISGQVDITAASNESDLTHYVLYWGTTAGAKLGSAITSLAKSGAVISYSFSNHTAVPLSATKLLVFTRNAIGEMATSVAVNINDKGLPENAAVSLSFTDSDVDGGQVQGQVDIVRAADESDITHYALYWGSSSTIKSSLVPITILAKTGSNLSHTFAANTSIYMASTHLLVFTQNADGEMGTPVAVAIVDKGVPVHAAVSVAFTDGDLDGGQLSGDVNITKASDESDVTDYVLYWGSNATTKASVTPIATIAKTSGNLTHTFAANTAIYGGATHLLVFTKNADGEMGTPVAVAIVDKGVPVHAAVSVAFTDGDLDGGQLSGDVNITKASDESDVTDYVLYWGSNATTKASVTPIATIAKTSGNLTHTFAANTAIYGGATHLLVFTKNADGEMGTPVAVAIVDKGVPVHAAAGISFTDGDLDGGQLSGDVNITKASDESDVTDYVLYWGSNATTKASATPIATIATTGLNVSHTFVANSALFSGATHLLVYTRNADGEMGSGVNVAIVDKGVPVHAAAGLSFTDVDVDGGQLQGTVTITKASNESDVTHYVLYWGSNATAKATATPIATKAVTGSNVTHTFAANTNIYSGATHFLVYTKNADGEMSTGISLLIDDVGIPVHAAVMGEYTDTDSTVGEIGGTFNITKANDESDVTHYVLYWGTVTGAKANGTPIATIAKTGSNLTYNIDANTTYGTARTILIYTKNDDGEMATPRIAHIKDNKRVYGATATCSGVYGSASCSNNVDGDLTTSWVAPSQNAWSEFALHSPINLKQIRITHGYDPAGNCNTSVYAGASSNPGTLFYTTGMISTTAYTVYDYTAGSAQNNVTYIRVTENSDYTWINLKEVEIYEE